MIYGYIRVSTTMQTNENQRLAINEYLKRTCQKVDVFYEDTISGTVDYHRRQLGELLKVVIPGDTIICTELSRLGRSMFMIFDVTQYLINKGVKVIAFKNNLTITKDDITSKVLIFAFGLSAEIERQLISERTKQALAYKKSQGVIIGHYRGYKCKNVKLTPYSDEITQLLKAGKSIDFIAKKYGVKWITARDFIRDRLKYNLNDIPSVKAFREITKNKPPVSNAKQGFKI